MQWLIERYLARQITEVIKSEIILHFHCGCEVSLSKVNKNYPYWELIVKTVDTSMNKQVIRTKRKSAKDILTFITNYNSLVSEIITSLREG